MKSRWAVIRPGLPERVFRFGQFKTNAKSAIETINVKFFSQLFLCAWAADD